MAKTPITWLKEEFGMTAQQFMKEWKELNSVDKEELKTMAQEQMDMG